MRVEGPEGYAAVRSCHTKSYRINEAKRLGDGKKVRTKAARQDVRLTKGVPKDHKAFDEQLASNAKLSLKKLELPYCSSM